MMRLVKHLLESKGHDILSISPEASVLEAIKLMAMMSVGALMVLEEERLVGIVTERDYARKVILKDRSSKDTAVHAIMSTEVITATLFNDVEHCMNVMTEKHIRHLPVIEKGQVVGMISIGDLVKAVMDDQKAEIQDLETYISS